MRSAAESSLDRPHRQGSNDMAKKASRRKAGSSSGKRSGKGQKRTPSKKSAGARARASASGVCPLAGVPDAKRLARKRRAVKRGQRRSGRSRSCGQPEHAPRNVRPLAAASAERAWSVSWRKPRRRDDPFGAPQTRCPPGGRQARRQARAAPKARPDLTASGNACERSRRHCQLRRRVSTSIAVRRRREADVTSCRRAAANITRSVPS